MQFYCADRVFSLAWSQIQIVNLPLGPGDPENPRGPCDPVWKIYTVITYIYKKFN